MIVMPDIAVNGGLQGSAGVEMMGMQDFADTAIETLDHAVGLRMTGRNQAMHDTEFLADLIESMFARGFTAFAGETIRELAAIVGQQLDDFHRGSIMQTFQEICAARLGLIVVNTINLKTAIPPRIFATLLIFR